MKIVHLVPAYAPHIGGVETHVAEVNQRLTAVGHNVVVLTTQHDSKVPLEEVVEGVEVKRIPQAIVNEKIPTWKWVWSQRQLLMDADRIQVHDVFWWLLPVLPLIEDKVFTTFHGWEGRFPVAVSAKLQRWVADQLSRGTVHVGDWIREFYWDRPNEVTYGGVNSVENVPRPPTHLTKMVFVGRLSRDNEVKKYIGLVKDLKTKHKNLEVVWVGDGELAAECRQVNSPLEYMKKADIVLAASYLSILEAQALGKVVSAFYSHRLKERYLETFPGAEWILISSTVEDMVAQILTLVENKKHWTEMSSKAHRFAQAQTWKKVTDLYLKLWNI
jgi:glycosyltransferase involved in cell wall biosynthesis